MQIPVQYKKMIRRIFSGAAVKQGRTKTLLSRADSSVDGELQKKICALSDAPQNSTLHAELADIYVQQKRWLPAIAQYRASLALDRGNQKTLLSLADAYLAVGRTEQASSICQDVLNKTDDKNQVHKINKLLAQARKGPLRPLTFFNHNRYFRLKTLANQLVGIYGNADFSVLDVGGGDGAMALFIPDSQYLLAEPSINGLSGTHLPFPEKFVDAVIACHVLEHIPVEDREHFLGQLCSRARDYVLLLNPFHQEEAKDKKRLELIVELTDAPWAREHLEHNPPSLEMVKKFAQKHGYRCRTWPNGALSTTVAMVFAEHYADLAGCSEEVDKINQFLNDDMFDGITNQDLPTAHLVELKICSSP